MDYVELIQQEYEWSDLPWKKFEKVLYKLQKRIYQASSRGDVKNVRRLQKLLIKSRSAKLISVRRVTQDNQGSKTAGVDGIKNLTPKQRFQLVDKINLSPKVSPVRRVWIPKPGKDKFVFTDCSLREYWDEEYQLLIDRDISAGINIKRRESGWMCSRLYDGVEEIQ